MIPRTETTWQTSGWQNELSRAIRDPQELLSRLKLPHDLLTTTLAASREFSLRVPRGFVDRMQPGNPRDPLLLQVLPQGKELISTPGFTKDPVGDLSAMPVPGVLHKYHGRVLLVLTGACAIHCRYCFRRQFPYSEANPIRENWQHALQYIENDSTINEVILSGGDPLLLEDHRLAPLVNALAEIPHLKRLRIHTRLPIVLPERITNDLIQLLSTNRLQTIMVIHTNHANEINDVISQALHKLHKNNITLLNQAVLLKNINDSTAIQAELCERLFANNVTPYYLHLLDKVNGSAHFDVDLEAGISISQELRTQLPGYLVPRLVKEQAGKDSKTPAELLIP